MVDVSSITALNVWIVIWLRPVFRFNIDDSTWQYRLLYDEPLSYDIGPLQLPAIIQI